MKLLIDGDVLVYRAGFAIQSKVNVVWEDDFTATYPPVSHALHAVKMMVNNIFNKCRHSDYVIYLSSDDRSNYRYGVAKTKPYKGNRKQPRPIYYNDIRDYLINNFNSELVHGQEADDAMGVASTYNSTVIVSIDKDLDMIPGYHYNFVKDYKYHVSKTQAYRNFCIQMLVGDPVDNIVGVKGIGPVKAEAAIAGCKRDKQKMLQVVYDLYDNEELFLEMGQLLWIRREEGEVWLPDLKSLRANKQASLTAGGQA